MTEKGNSQMVLVDDNKKVVVVIIGSQNLWKEHIRGMEIEVKGRDPSKTGRYSVTHQLRFSDEENSREKLPDLSSYSKSGQERYESDKVYPSGIIHKGNKLQ